MQSYKDIFFFFDVVVTIESDKSINGSNVQDCLLHL